MALSLPSIAIHRGHNAGICLFTHKEILEVIELERFLNIKNCSFDNFTPISTPDTVVDSLLRYIKHVYGYTTFDKVIITEDTKLKPYIKKFEAKDYVLDFTLHHRAHANSSYFQSEFDHALILSFDGGSPEGYFNIYYRNRKQPLEILGTYNIDLGSHYHVIGSVCDDVKNYNELTAAGKVMGLQSYGQEVKGWKKPLRDFFLSLPPYYNNLSNKIDNLSKNLGIVFSKQNKLKGENAYNLARTSQIVFEEIVYSKFDKYVDANPDTPLIITGGCALNIILNTNLKNRYGREVFVAPNSSDCGLPVGIASTYNEYKETQDLTYKGLSILDQHTLPEYVEKFNAKKKPVKDIANDLSLQLLD